jgi:uncharacterized protein (DUF1684 family)
MTHCLLLAALAVTANKGQTPETPAHYTARITQWRKDHAEELMKNEGPLAMAGLFWLEEGDTPIGTGKSNKIVLPAGATSERVGVLSLHDGRVTLKIDRDAAVVVSGAAASGTVDMQPESTRADMGDLTIMVIHRGKRIGIRMFDLNCRGRREFEGLKWYPVDPAYRVRAKYTEYATPKSLPITNILGDTSPVANPGYVEFTVDGKMCRLEAQSDGAGFFFNFHDGTSGHETYPAGRFLNTPGPQGGYVDLDFNMAVNPPCAFTKYATCPLPPKDNFLNVAIPAGEKTHHPVGD